MSEHKREIKYHSDEGHPWEEDSRMSEAEYSSESLQPAEQNFFGELLYGKSLKWYWEVCLWPVFVLVLVEIGIRVMQTKYLVTVNPDLFEWLINLFRLLVLIYLPVMAVRQFGAEKKQAIAAGTIGGFVAGFILALFQLFWYFELWALFNLIGQPLLLAVEGLVVGWILMRILKIKKVNK